MVANDEAQQGIYPYLLIHIAYRGHPTLRVAFPRLLRNILEHRRILWRGCGRALVKSPLFPRRHLLIGPGVFSSPSVIYQCYLDSRLGPRTQICTLHFDQQTGHFTFREVQTSVLFR
jgi:hypothetical protein